MPRANAAWLWAVFFVLRSAVMQNRGVVLVAIVNNIHDFDIARDQHWYRIPVSSQEKWLRHRWPPDWLAFYHTKVFGQDAHSVRYFARVRAVRPRRRHEILPCSSNDPKRDRLYHQLLLGKLRKLAQPIISPRWRRIVFVQTTLVKLHSAIEINDLYDESPLEDHVWTELKRLNIPAERQLHVEVGTNQYFLDFAIACASGKIDVETDGDFWHANPERASADNVRDNELKTVGWRILRFNTPQIREEMATYTLPKIVENIDKLGGVVVGTTVPRVIGMATRDGYRQLGLFHDIASDQASCEPGERISDE